MSPAACGSRSKATPLSISRLIDNGVAFDLDPQAAGDMRYHLTREGGHSHRRILHSVAYQRRFNRMAGGVSAVQDTAMTVAAFPRQVITHVAGRLRIEIKSDTVVDQPLHTIAVSCTALTPPAMRLKRRW